MESRLENNVKLNSNDFTKYSDEDKINSINLFEEESKEILFKDFKGCEKIASVFLKSINISESLFIKMALPDDWDLIEEVKDKKFVMNTISILRAKENGFDGIIAADESGVMYAINLHNYSIEFLKNQLEDYMIQ